MDLTPCFSGPLTALANPFINIKDEQNPGQLREITCFLKNQRVRDYNYEISGKCAHDRVQGAHV